MNEIDFAPQPGCACKVCLWATARRDREQRLAEDLADNYRKYEAGELVSRDDRE